MVLVYMGIISPELFTACTPYVVDCCTHRLVVWANPQV